MHHTKWLQGGLDVRGHAGTRPDISAAFHISVMGKKKRTQSRYFLIISRILWMCIRLVFLLQITWRARNYCLLHDTYLRSEHIYSHSWYSRTIILFSVYKCLMGHGFRQQFSSPSYICNGVGPLVGPFRFHVSRSLFKGLPWFLLPVVEERFITLGNLLPRVMKSY